MDRIIDIHAHVFPDAIAQKASDSICEFYNLQVRHSGTVSELLRYYDEVGQSEIVSGEIAMDFAHYFTVSEQQPSLVALGVLVSESTVLKAGGLLIQPLPGCPDEIIDQLELRSPMFADISREMTFASIDQLCEDWFRGMEPRILERTPVQYRCTCRRECTGTQGAEGNRPDECGRRQRTGDAGSQFQHDQGTESRRSRRISGYFPLLPQL